MFISKSLNNEEIKNDQNPISSNKESLNFKSRALEAPELDGLIPSTIRFNSN